MLGCNIAGKLNSRVFCVLLAVFFLSLLIESTAELIIKEKMELTDTTKSKLQKDSNLISIIFGNNIKEDIKDNLVNMSNSIEYDWQDEAENAAKPVYGDLIKLIQNTSSGINGIKDGYRIYGFNNFKATPPTK